MSSKLDLLNDATPETEDVGVLLNKSGRRELEALQEKLGAATQRLANLNRAKKKDPEELEAAKSEQEAVAAAVEAKKEELRAQVLMLRFTALPSPLWQSIIAKSAPRKTFTTDAHKGYNVHEVTKLAAQVNGVVVEDDGSTTALNAAQWAKLWESLSGGDFDRVWGTITRLNERNGWEGVEFLKKD